MLEHPKIKGKKYQEKHCNCCNRRFKIKNEMKSNDSLNASQYILENPIKRQIC